MICKHSPTGVVVESTPSNWRPLDRSWFVYTDWDLWGTKFSGNTIDWWLRLRTFSTLRRSSGPEGTTVHNGRSIRSGVPGVRNAFITARDGHRYVIAFPRCED